MHHFWRVIQLQNGLDVVSLKSIDPTLPSYQNGMGTKQIISYIDALRRDITVGGMPANRILDVRIPKGTTNCLNLEQILNYANRYGITVSIKEF